VFRNLTRQQFVLLLVSTQTSDGAALLQYRCIKTVRQIAVCVASSLSAVYRIVPVVPDHILQIDLTVLFCSVFHWLWFKTVKSHHVMRHGLAAVCKRCERRANECASRRGNEGNTRIICFDGILLVGLQVISQTVTLITRELWVPACCQTSVGHRPEVVCVLYGGRGSGVAWRPQQTRWTPRTFRWVPLTLTKCVHIWYSEGSWVESGT
jgi:hypothetical protein